MNCRMLPGLAVVSNTMGGLGIQLLSHLSGKLENLFSAASVVAGWTSWRGRWRGTMEGERGALSNQVSLS